jgi:hypothetical protein
MVYMQCRYAAAAVVLPPIVPTCCQKAEGWKLLPGVCVHTSASTSPVVVMFSLPHANTTAHDNVFIHLIVMSSDTLGSTSIQTRLQGQVRCRCV